MAAMTTTSAPTQHPAASVTAATVARTGRSGGAVQPAGGADLFARLLQGADAAAEPVASTDKAAADRSAERGTEAAASADEAVDTTRAQQTDGAPADATALAQWLQQLGLMVPAPPASAVSAAGASSAGLQDGAGRSARGTPAGGSAAEGVAFADLPSLAAGAAGLLHRAAGMEPHKGMLPGSRSRSGADQPGMSATTAEAAAAAADPAARAGTTTATSLAEQSRTSSAAPSVGDAATATAATRTTESAGRRDFATLLGDASAAAGQLAQQGVAPPTAWPQAGAGAAAPVSQPVPVPVDDPDFGGVMMSQMVNLARDGVQQAELHLNPAGMGPIMVQIAISQDQARIQFEAAHAGTRALIEQSLPTLAQSLRDDGLQLAASSVVAPPAAAQDLGASAQGGQPDQPGQGWAGANGADSGAAGRGPGALSGVGDLAGPVARPAPARLQPAGRLDLYA
ncbi:MAG: flagellar hook-length control protein [Pseudomonadota bacterium]|jgi:flagellar hook-length control protein FliK